MKPLILVTNDDGIVSPGIKHLVYAARSFGEVVVVAPDSPQSAKGHSISIYDPIHIRKVDVFDGVESFECSGTPVDCVKIARKIVLKDRVPDICLSGINHGLNSAINIIYSGTMSAAMEAAMEGIPSIGFSLDDFSFKADFSSCMPFVESIIKYGLDTGLEHGKLLNVNFPKGKIKGIKLCRQAEARWVEDFKINEDPRGRKYYWLTGHFQSGDEVEGTDVHALQNGFASVVPAQYDLTDYKALDSGLRMIEKIEI